MSRNQTKISLTVAERNSVDAKHKETPPTYYDANLGADVPIGDDFEAFLIVVGDQQRQSAIDWLKDIKSLQAEDAQRDGILNEWLDSEVSSVTNARISLDLDLKTYSEWQDSFVSDPKFAAIPELQQLLRDLRAPAASLFSLQRRLEHRRVLLGLVRQRLVNGGLRAGQLRQTISWLRPLKAY